MRKLILQALGCWPKVSYVNLSANFLYYSVLATSSYSIGRSLGALINIHKAEHEFDSSSTGNAIEPNKAEEFAKIKSSVQPSTESPRKNYALQLNNLK